MCGLVLAASVAGAASALPYADGFEAATQPGTAWDNGGTVQGSASATYKLAGSKGLYMSNGWVKLQVTGQPTNAWVQVYTKPAPFYTTPTNSMTGVAGAFYVASTKYLRAYSGSTWSNLVADFPTNQSEWIGFAAHLDYKAKKWDLYYTRNGYDTTMSRANAGPLSFSSSGAPGAMSNILISTEAQAPIDAFAACSGGAVGVNANSKQYVKVTMSDMLNPTKQLTGLAGHDFTGGDATLGGALGSELAALTSPGDTIRVYHGTGYWTYTNSGTGWVRTDIAYPLPGACTNYGGRGFDIAADATPLSGRAFFHQFNAGTVAYDSVPIKGDVSGTGWNMLAWPKSTSVANSSSSRWGFSVNAVTGDKLYIRDKANRKYKMLAWKNGQWMDGASSASYVLKSGDGMWYYTTGNGDWTWNVNSAQ
jgi:hypothetical protein